MLVLYDMSSPTDRGAKGTVGLAFGGSPEIHRDLRVKSPSS